MAPRPAERDTVRFDSVFQEVLPRDAHAADQLLPAPYDTPMNGSMPRYALSGAPGTMDQLVEAANGPFPSLQPFGNDTLGQHFPLPSAPASPWTAFDEVFGWGLAMYDNGVLTSAPYQEGDDMWLDGWLTEVLDPTGGAKQQGYLPVPAARSDAAAVDQNTEHVQDSAFDLALGKHADESVQKQDAWVRLNRHRA